MAITVDNGELTDFDVDVGAGNVGADTQRVTLAADDPAVVSLAAIETAVEGTLTVTGTVTTGGLTDAELRATPVPVSGSLTVDLGANNDVTVTGTVDLGATDNAVLDAIAASVAAIDVDTSTIIGHVDGIEGLLATIDADTGNIVTAVQLLDDAAVVLGTATYTEATSTGLVMAAVRRDADTTLANTTNEYTPLQVDANGRLKVEAFSGESLPVTLTSTTITGTVAATQSGTWNIGSITTLPALVAGTANIGDVDVLTLPNVTLAAGTNTNEVVGDIAHGTAVGGNPVQIGLEGRSTVGTAVDDGDVVRALATTHGKQVVMPFAIPAATKSYASPAAVTDTADDEAFAAIASTRTYITSVQVFNADATVGTEVVIKDGSTVLWRGYAAALGGGCSATFATPLRGTANTAVNVANITTSAETYFNLQGYSATE
jgi:hypothetical protein